MSRADRRFKRESKIKKRAKEQYIYFSSSFSKFYGDLKEGVHFQYLKHTGRVCSCSICKRPRYSKKDRKQNKIK